MMMMMMIMMMMMMMMIIIIIIIITDLLEFSPVVTADYFFPNFLNKS